MLQSQELSQEDAPSTLASQTTSKPYTHSQPPYVWPLNAFTLPEVYRHNGGSSDDFQSNAQTDSPHSSDSDPPLAGLGIRYNPATFTTNNQDRDLSVNSWKDPPDEPMHSDPRSLTGSSKSSPGREPAVPASWSFSSMLSAAACATDVGSSTSIGDLMYPVLENPWTNFGSQSASGTSDDPFGTRASPNSQISGQSLRTESHDHLSYRSFSAETNSTSGTYASSNSAESLLRDPPPWPILPQYIPAPGPSTDRKIYKTVYQESSPGINPADLSRMTCENPLVGHLSLASLLNSVAAQPPNDFRATGLNDAMVSDIVINRDNLAPKSSSGAFYHILQIDKRSEVEPTPTSDYEPSLRLSSAPSHDSSSSFPSPPPKRKTRASRARSRVKKSIQMLPDAQAGPVVQVQEEATNIQAPEVDEGLAVDLGTPVLDAHRGIELEELKAKAERYRLRNVGKEYDKRWLLSFAGKLSARGELVDEFRCYVNDCTQTNKRRDHILIHLGAHLDQRPFQCTHCSSRFLRKNECKRHELSHTGARPFTCMYCPFEETAFVRQDLLKRHLKRTHHIESSSKKAANKENQDNGDEPRPRKKAKRVR